ncbi:MAG: hypothetical protein ACPL0B_01990 [Anaerolineales bacterium]
MNSSPPSFTPITLTPTFTFTPTFTITITPTATPTSTITPIPPTATTTPYPAFINRINLPSHPIYQQPGGPTIGVLKSKDEVLVLSGIQIYDGLVWLQIQDKEGRIGWVPQINPIFAREPWVLKLLTIPIFFGIMPCTNLVIDFV